jgi:hypothetical protein
MLLLLYLYWPFCLLVPGLAYVFQLRIAERNASDTPAIQTVRGVLHSLFVFVLGVFAPLAGVALRELATHGPESALAPRHYGFAFPSLLAAASAAFFLGTLTALDWATNRLLNAVVAWRRRAPSKRLGMRELVRYELPDAALLLLEITLLRLFS